MTVTLAELVSLAGLVFGVSGCVLGILNYRRDSARIEVTLQWDLAVTPDTEYDPDKKWGCIAVVNVGRRAAYISHVALRLPKSKYEHSHLLIKAGIAGKKLSEGDPAEHYMVSQNDMEQYAKHWRQVVAQVSDSSGKVWLSRRVHKKAVPSWASQVVPQPSAQADGPASGGSAA